MTPLVSVVIPTYNRARDIERALKSVQNQTYVNWEALIVDNHSSDNTEEIVARLNDPRIKFIKIHNAGVIAKSRNLGIYNAQGKYVAFLDSDDWWTPQKLERSLKYLEQGADVVYHDLFVVTRPRQRIFWRKATTRRLGNPAYVDLIVNGNALATSSTMLRKSILLEMGGLLEDENLIGVEDFELWLRVAKITQRFVRIPQPLGYYWGGGGNTSDPARDLKKLRGLEQRYGRDLLNLSIGMRQSWSHYYCKGRNYYMLKSYELAADNLARLRWFRIPPVIALKKLWMMVVIMFMRSANNI